MSAEGKQFLRIGAAEAAKIAFLDLGRKQDDTSRKKEYLAMKIEGPGKTQKTDKAKTKNKVSSGDSSFGDMVSKGAQDAQSSSGPQAVARVDALLAVQGAEDPTARAARRRMHQRAEHILDELEHIKMRLLTGTLTVGDVLNVADVVAAHREKIMDPRLTAVLDEIDLRAQVEIAKMRAAMESTR